MLKIHFKRLLKQSPVKNTVLVLALKSVQLYTDNKLQLLIQSTLESKSKYEFDGESCESKSAEYNFMTFIAKTFKCLSNVIFV